MASLLLLLAASSVIIASPLSADFSHLKRQDTVDNNVCYNPPFISGPNLEAPGGLDRLWMTLPCNLVEIENTGGKYAPLERWNAARGTNALGAAQICWALSKGSNNGMSLSQSISNYFHGPDGMHCEVLDDAGGATTNCQSTVQCSEAGHAAGFQVINSMVALHSVNQGIFGAMEAAKVNIIGRVGKFGETFSPNVDQLKAFKLFLDIISMGFIVAAAPMFNVVLKNGIGAANPNALGTVKDITNGLVNGGLTYSKDKFSQSTSQLKTQNALSDKATLLIDSWKEAVRSSNAAIFSGDPQNLWPFVSSIDGGTLLDFKYAAENAEISKNLEKALWAAMIPWAWQLSNDDHRAFLMTPEKPDDSKGCEGWGVDYDYIDDSKVWNKAFVCVDNKPYWLVTLTSSGEKGPADCPQDFNNPCLITHYFRNVPGADDLQTSDAWGISKLDIATSSVRSFQANGNKNGYAPDFATQEFIDRYLADGVASAGIFTLPICDGMTARLNWGESGADSDPNYPCQEWVPS